MSAILYSTLCIKRKTSVTQKGKNASRTLEHYASWEPWI
uniref:Uncharacterized protein n=1 Tax=Arundo donax TaxID=35708 RepID=A0A0A8YVH8_ARUDO